MTYRNREECFSVSEDVPFCHSHPGYPLFSHPAQVDHWCQSVSYGQELPLTPPDTASECAISDCQDMTSQAWSQNSLPEETWITEPVQDHSTYVRSSGSDWQSHGAPVTSQDMRALEAATWLNTPHGNVDLGLSPVLSHESQSSHTLNSLSEPDMSFLPPSLDLSFTAEPSWNPSGPVMYTSHQLPDTTLPGSCYTSTPTQVAHGPYMAYHTGPTAPQSTGPYMHQPVYMPQDAPMPYPKRTVSYSYVPQRPLLPRTEGSAVPSQPVYGPQRVLRPQVPVSQSSQSTVSNVSNMPGQTFGPSYHIAGHVRSPLCASSPASQPATSYVPRTSQSVTLPRSEVAAQIKPVGPVGYLADRTEDWSSFIQYDQEDFQASSGSFSYATGYTAVPGVAPPVPPSNVKPLAAKTEQEAIPSVQATTSSPTTLSAETEEGRHRTHPLYNEGPQADGLYHCPFKSDPSCQHKPTKLKCNYDKFIDSHIKPFRCKMDACAKQEFSSTACLLRHEREAHGMHGHGDRPHLCYYPGCERGIPGNGFPRRYNLFDHMKRVHDHKEEPTSLTGSPVMSGEMQAPKRIAGRKRKASAPIAEEPAVQRQRSEPTSTQGLQSMTMPQVAYSQPSLNFQQADAGHRMQRRDSQHRQRLIYSQWANQRELLARQMDFVQGPDDEANLQSLSQNIEELRRLSQEARRS